MCRYNVIREKNIHEESGRNVGSCICQEQVDRMLKPQMLFYAGIIVIYC